MIHVLYHANCADGFLSRVIAQRKLGFAANYTAVNYKQPLPKAVTDDLDAEVYILDFSYPRETMLRLQDRAKKVVCLDHHKTAQAALEGLECCTFDMQKSGAMLTWEHFNRGQVAPQLVQYVQDRDLGKPWSDPDQSLPGSLEVHAALFRAMPRTYQVWDQWLDQGSVELLIMYGSPIADQDRALVQSVAAKPIWICLEGHIVPSANLPFEYFSDVGAEMLKMHPGAPFACFWYVDPENGRVNYSLRSRKGGFDLTELVTKFGGGGHPCAARFDILEMPQFVDI